MLHVVAYYIVVAYSIERSINSWHYNFNFSL